MTNCYAESSSGRTAHETRFTLMGPALITVVGYIGPSNFATNIQAGVDFDYQLLWVIARANLVAMLTQALSTKLGTAAGKDLVEQIHDHYPRLVVWLYWAQVEIVAMVTDLVEFIGVATGFELILGVSLLQGAMLMGAATFLISMLQRHRQKPLERVIGRLLLFVAVVYIVELIFSWPNLAQPGKGMVIPSLPTSETVFLAAGMSGAMIMSHVVYLHPSLAQHLHGGPRRQYYSAIKWDVAIAMTIVDFVSLVMMTTVAAVFHSSGHTSTADLDEVYLALQLLLSHVAITVSGLSLITAGLFSTVVRMLAGQIAMQGFIRLHIPLWVCRTATMLLSSIVILTGLDPTRTLVMNQVLLSLGIALTPVPLSIFTSDSKLMGDLVSSKCMKQIGWVIVVLVAALNTWLLVGTALGLQLNERRI